MNARLAVVGATGLVGENILKVLEDRKFPYASVKFLASVRSAGKPLDFAGKSYTVGLLEPSAFRDVDIVLSSTPSSVSKSYAPQAAEAGAVVVDNSSAWRMDANTPLVVPEVNPHAALKHRGIIANPNCATIQMVVALKPLYNLSRIRRLVISTYQSSSGKGAKALQEFDAQVMAAGRQQPLPPVAVHRRQLFGNCIPDDWTPGADGYNEEEIKIVNETRKIMEDDSIGVSVTCVRVPVRVGHGTAINVEFHEPVSAEAAQAALAKAPGVVLLDGDADGRVPLATLAEGRDETFVGRVRRDPSSPNALNLWVVADNLRKGAATNAVQIAELLLPTLKR